MRKLTITNADNTKISVDLVRYFKFKNECFLIYSTGEVDEKNFNKLYLVSIAEELGFPVARTFKNDTDWTNMQGIMKKVLKELKRGKKKLIEDLDSKEIEGIKIVEPRFFKLDSKLTDLLASNYLLQINENINVSDTSIPIDQDELEPIDQTMMRENVNNSGLFLANDEVMVDNSNVTEEKHVLPNEDFPKEKSDNERKLNQEIKSVDYKKMYEVLKKDNTVTNNLLNKVMLELNKYKEKYGELDGDSD